MYQCNKQEFETLEKAKQYAESFRQRTGVILGIEQVIAERPEKQGVAKSFNIQTNIGKSRYVVNFHDGVKTHRDGSLFFDVEIVSNKRSLNRFVTALKADGYVEA